MKNIVKISDSHDEDNPQKTKEWKYLLLINTLSAQTPFFIPVIVKAIVLAERSNLKFLVFSLPGISIILLLMVSKKIIIKEKTLGTFYLMLLISFLLFYYKLNLLLAALVIFSGLSAVSILINIRVTHLFFVANNDINKKKLLQVITLSNGMTLLLYGVAGSFFSIFPLLVIVINILVGIKLLFLEKGFLSNKENEEKKR